MLQVDLVAGGQRQVPRRQQQPGLAVEAVVLRQRSRLQQQQRQQLMAVMSWRMLVLHRPVGPAGASLSVARPTETR